MSSLSPTLTASSLGPSPNSPLNTQPSDNSYGSPSGSFNSGSSIPLSYTPYFSHPSYPNFEDILDTLLSSPDGEGAGYQAAIQQLRGYLTTSYLHYSPSTFESFYTSKFLASVRPLLSSSRSTSRLVGLRCLELLLDILSSSSDTALESRINKMETWVKATLVFDEKSATAAMARATGRGMGYAMMPATLRDRERDQPTEEEGWKVTEEAGKVYATLCRLGGTSMIEETRAQLKTSIEWLQNTRKEVRFHAATVVIRLFAVEVPNIVWPEASEIVDNLWRVLVDPLAAIRVSAAKALGAVLALANARDKKQHSLKEMVFNLAQKTIENDLTAWNAGAAKVKGKIKVKDSSEFHGGVLAIEQLWKHCPLFMAEKYETTMDILNELRDSSDPLIRQTVLDVVSLVVDHNAMQFCKSPQNNTYLHRWMIFLLGQIRKGVDRGPSFKTIGAFAEMVGDEISPWLEKILEQMIFCLRGSDASTNSVKRSLSTPNTENDSIFSCIAGLTLSLAHHPQLCGQLPALIDLMGTYELSQDLQQAYLFLCNMQVNESYTSLQRIVNLVRARTLDAISIILTGERFEYPGAPQDWFDSTDFPISYSLISKLPTPTYTSQKRIEIITLALDTLLSCDFGTNLSLQQFLHEWITLYLNDEEPRLRAAAAECCCDLLVVDKVVNRKSRTSIQVAKDVVDLVVHQAVRDSDPSVRLKTMNAIRPELDETIAQADVVELVLLTLEDEIFEMRIEGVRLLSRLANHNPAYVLPSMRLKMISLMGDLDCAPNMRLKHESATLLRDVVRFFPHLAKRNFQGMVNVILEKAKQPNPSVAITSMEILGQLVWAGEKEEVRPKLPSIMILVVDILEKHTSKGKRLAALELLGNTARATGYVVQPYLDHPQLMFLLHNILVHEHDQDLCREAVKVMGILGAIDPQKITSDSRHSADPSASASTTTFDPSDDEYNQRVAFHALMEILRDSALANQHTFVVDAVMFIFRSMRQNCVTYLAMVIPTIVATLKAAPPRQIEFYFQSLGQLVSITGVYVRHYLHILIPLIHEFWETVETRAIVAVFVESLAKALASHIRSETSNLLSLLLSACDGDARDPRQQKVMATVLRSLPAFGANLKGECHLIVPVLINSFSRKQMPTEVRVAALQCVCRLADAQIDLSEYFSGLMHPLLRAAKEGNNEIAVAAYDAVLALGRDSGHIFLQFSPVIEEVLLGSSEYIRARFEEQFRKLMQRLLAGESGRGLRPHLATMPGAEMDLPTLKMPIDPRAFQSILELSDRARSGDWKDWLKSLSSHLLRTSPSPALRACANVTDTYHPYFMDLLNAAYLSVWRELSPAEQIALAGVIEAALTASSIPPQIVQTLLNLAFHMEHYLEQATAEERRGSNVGTKPRPAYEALFIDFKILGASAQQCTSWAKALHYKELELKEQPTAQIIQDLIRINNELHHDDANQGILTLLPSDTSGPLPETYFEKLGQWDKALALYDHKLRDKPDSFSGNLGKMRALHALGQWEELSTLAEGIWKLATIDMKRRIAPLAADAAWSLLQYDQISKYVAVLKNDSPNRAWLKAIVNVNKNQFDLAERQISRARDLLISELHTMLGESYSRAYNAIVRVQFLSEIEEIIMFRKASMHQLYDRMEDMNQMWNKRLLGCERDVDIWQRALKLRAVVLGRSGPPDITIKYANLCRKAGRYTLASKALEPFRDSSGPFGFPPDVEYARLKLVWAQGRRDEAFRGMSSISRQLEEDRAIDEGRQSQRNRDRLLSRCHLKVGMWKHVLREQGEIRVDAPRVLDSFRKATQLDPCWPKAWHQWALINAEIVESCERHNGGQLEEQVIENVVAAVQGFFLALRYAKGSTLQYSLRLLTLCFKYGDRPEVVSAIKKYVDHVSQDTWLLVIPQLISRIDTKQASVQSFVQNILVRLGHEHPQSLVYPLTIAANSSNENRKKAAKNVSNQIRTVYPHLVDQAATVAKELIRVAVSWQEQWEMGLVEASRLDKELNEGAMFEALDKLHDMLKRGAETDMERKFLEHYLRHLNRAKEYIERYHISADPADLNKGWDAYVAILQRMSHENKKLQRLELERVAPALLELQNQKLEVAVPGTYQTGKPVISIVAFASVLDVFNSKHRPRKLVIKGSDGHDYAFLLKGHEDLRQDERVMQLLDLLNPLLLQDADASKRHLSVKKYPVVPLSAHSGLLGWVENTDTLHGMILKHRQMKKVAVNMEHQLIITMSGGEYDFLTLMQKIEVFEFSLINTADAADDLGQAMWLRSPSAMYWFIKRCNFVRSVAAMSMIGYILGLGDRHPLNILMEKGTGRVVHVDLGDCWEVAMHRERYPEKVPFRLTRMIVGAMEASGTEGTFKTSCNIVMRILRDYRESVEAVMEAFLVDPLINWKLVAPEVPLDMYRGRVATDDGEIVSTFSPSRYPMERPRMDENNQPDEGTVNQKAQQVINRIIDKLTGRDFKPSETLSVEEQVQKLIEQAQTYENLCQCFLGWCPFW